MAALLGLDMLKRIAAFVDIRDVGRFSASCKTFAAIMESIYEEVVEHLPCFLVKNIYANDIQEERKTFNIEICYMKNTILGSGKSPAIGDVIERIKKIMDICIDDECFYIDLTYFTGVKRITIESNTKINNIPIFIDLPQYCGKLCIKLPVDFNKLNLVASIFGGSVVKKLAASCNIWMEENIKICGTMTAKYTSVGRNIYACEVLSLLPDVKKLPIQSYEGSPGDVTHNNLEELFLNVTNGIINFRLMCPKLRVLNLHSSFCGTDIQQCLPEDRGTWTAKKYLTEKGVEKILNAAAFAAHFFLSTLLTLFKNAVDVKN